MKKKNTQNSTLFYYTLIVAFIFTALDTGYSSNYWELDEHKFELTAPALHMAGWRNENAIYKVNRANEYTDIYDQSNIVRGGFCRFRPASCKDSHILETIVNTASFNCYPFPIDTGPVTGCTKGFHFDNLFSYQIIQERWDSLKSWAKFQSDQINNNNNFTVDYWLTLIGIVLHAVQDFYAHSNWVIITSYYGYPNSVINGNLLPTWEELEDMKWLENHRNFQKTLVTKQFKISNEWTSDREFERKNGKVNVYGGLQTGRWTDIIWVLNEQRVFPWGHRHPGDPGMTRKRDELNRDAFGYFHVCSDEKNAAMKLSIRASHWWIEFLTSEELLRSNRQKFIDYVTTEPELDNQFNVLFESLNHEIDYFPKFSAFIDSAKIERYSIDAINE